MIPSAFEALQRGFERERERLRGKPFVVAATRHEFDYVNAAEIVGPELFAYLGAESEVTWYLMKL